MIILNIPPQFPGHKGNNLFYFIENEKQQLYLLNLECVPCPIAEVKYWKSDLSFLQNKYFSIGKKYRKHKEKNTVLGWVEVVVK